MKFTWTLASVAAAAVAVSLCGVGLLISESLNAIECVYIMMKLK